MTTKENVAAAAQFFRRRARRLDSESNNLIPRSR